jgi:hypothetical protein
MENGDAERLDGLRSEYESFLTAIARASGESDDQRLAAELARDARGEWDVIARLGPLVAQVRRSPEPGAAAAADSVADGLSSGPGTTRILAAWSVLRRAGWKGAARGGGAARESRRRFDELRLRPVLVEALRTAGVEEGSAAPMCDLVRLLIGLRRDASAEGDARGRPQQLALAWLADDDVRAFLRVNEWNGVLWFDREAFDQLTRWLLVLDAVDSAAAPRPPAGFAATWTETAAVAAELRRAAAAAGYEVDRLAAWASTPDPMPGPRRPGEIRARPENRC